MSVTINSQGAFFAQPNANGTVGSVGPNRLGRSVFVTFANAADAEAATLLHELGHQTGVLPSDLDLAVNGANTFNILANCFTLNAQGVWQ